MGLVTVLYIVIETGVMYTLLWIVCLLEHDRVLGDRGYEWSTYWMCQISVRTLHNLCEHITDTLVRAYTLP